MRCPDETDGPDVSQSGVEIYLCGSSKCPLDVIYMAVLSKDCILFMPGLFCSKEKASSRLNHQRRVAVEEEAVLTAYQKKVTRIAELLV